MLLPTRARLAAPLAALALLNLPILSHAQAPPASQEQSADGSDLSPAQRGRADVRQAQFQKEVAALRSNTKLTDAQKQAKYQTLFQAMDKDMLAILTPSQRTEVLKQRQVNQQFQKDVLALRSNTKLTDAQKQAQYQTLVQKRQDALLATLTPAQRAGIEKQHQAQIARQAEVKRLAQDLQKSQTPAQERKIREIGLTAGAEIQKVIADKSVPESAKPAKIQELEKQAQVKINALLTPAQRTMYAHIQSVAAAPLPQ